MRYLVVPQWQGSPSSRAMQLMDGAAAIAGDLPAAATTAIEVPLEAGDSEGTGVHRFSSIRVVRQRIASALEGVTDVVVGIGGDCGISYPLVYHAATPDTALLWFDAHGDSNSPATSPSKAFAGMPVRALVDDGLVRGDRVVHVGARDWDAAERDWTAEAGVTVLDADHASDAPDAVAATGASDVYVHVDLDVIDPAEFESVQQAEPFGVHLDALLAAIRGALTGRRLVGATIAGFAPFDDESAADDLPTVLRILAALRSSASDPA